MNSANEIDVDSSDSHQKKHKKLKKRKTRRTHEKSNSQSRSNSLRRQSSSSCNDVGMNDGKIYQKTNKGPSNIVEYSDVSSTDFSDPEAGEIDTDNSLIICEDPVGSGSVGKKRQNECSSKTARLPSQRQDVRLDMNISSEEESYRYL